MGMERDGGAKAVVAREMTRRQALLRGARVAAGAAMVAAPLWSRAAAAAMGTLDVAYAGSMGSLMEGPVKAAVARSLHLEMHGRGQGANALAALIAGGSVRPDVFISVTPGPMMTVLKAGKANVGRPIAGTSMVIAYSPKSRFAGRLDAAAKGRAPWWEVLEEPGFRFGRSDPATDPQGRNIIFAMMLAGKKYGQPDLVAKVLGPTVNPQQIRMEASVQARLQSGELDAASAYRIQPGPFHLPYIPLPADVNLSGADVHAEHPDVSLTINGKKYFPEPLIYYAAAMKDAPNPAGAAAFAHWLQSMEAKEILRQNNYDSPGSAPTLHL